jgi:hypothetical protein
MAKLTTVKDGNGNASYPDPEKNPTNAQGRKITETRKGKPTGSRKCDTCG